jgi:hypothetical protein
MSKEEKEILDAANKVELINTALRKVNPERAELEKQQLEKQQEAINEAIKFRSDLALSELLKLTFDIEETSATASTGTVCNPWQPWNNPVPQQTFYEMWYEALINGTDCSGICQPVRPEVQRKTVQSRIVEPLALPPG